MLQISKFRHYEAEMLSKNYLGPTFHFYQNDVLSDILKTILLPQLLEKVRSEVCISIQTLQYILVLSGLQG